MLRKRVPDRGAVSRPYFFRFFWKFGRWRCQSQDLKKFWLGVGRERYVRDTWEMEEVRARRGDDEYCCEVWDLVVLVSNILERGYMDRNVQSLPISQELEATWKGHLVGD